MDLLRGDLLRGDPVESNGLLAAFAKYLYVLTRYHLGRSVINFSPTNQLGVLHYALVFRGPAAVVTKFCHEKDACGSLVATTLFLSD